MKILLFGTGDYYERYKKWFSNEDIVALLDNSKIKQNTMLDGILVCSPEKGIQFEFDKIIILSFYVKEMKQQLLDLGVSENVIFHFFDLHRIIDVKHYVFPVQYYGNAENIITNYKEQRKVLLLSQDLTLGGPAIALFHVAEVLVKYGVTVVYASMMDGPLREKLVEKNIPVIVDCKLQVGTMNEVEWTSVFSLILCNTINFYVLISDRNTNIPVIWWLHDAEFFYDGVDKEILRNINRKNLQVVSVGPIPKKAIQKFVPNLLVESLLYGVEDIYKGAGKYGVRSEKIRFVTIGFLENIKGQDVLIRAVNLLPEELRKRTEFYLVGYDDTLFGQYIKEKSEEFPEIKFVGSVNRERIHTILNAADVLICPSRQDSMPTVAAEAMMHSVPCIVSDVTGTAKYISNGKDGFTFTSENSEELAEKIEWCVKNRSELKLMGTHARELFEKVFSMEVFEKSILELVSNI